MALDDDNDSGGGNDVGSELGSTPTAPVTIEERPEDDGDEEVEAKPTGGRDDKGRWAAKQKGRDQDRSKLRIELDALRSERQSWQTRMEEMTRSQSAERQQYLAALAARTGQGERPQQQPAGGGEVKQIRDALQAERLILANDPKRTTDRYDELMDQLVDARARAVAKTALEEHSKNNPGTQQPQRNVEREVRVAQLTGEFPWIHTDAAAVKAAGAYRTYLIASGSPDTLETDRLALAHIATERRLGSTPGPSQRQRQAYVAPAGGSLPSRGGPRQVQVPDARMLRGTGLSDAKLRAALFSKDE